MTDVFSFITTREEDPNRKTFNRAQFLSFDYGTHTVRFMSSFSAIYTHFISKSKATIKCLGDDCPICKNNHIIFTENPGNRSYSSIEGFCAKQYRHYANVMDRTLIKNCPQCQTEIKKGLSTQFPTNCPACGVLVNTIEPHKANLLKVVNISDTNASVLKSKMLGVLDIGQSVVDPMTYDVVFIVIKIGGKKNISPDLLVQSNDVVTLPEGAELFDLTKIVPILSAEEIIEVLKGVSLKDIYNSRKGEPTAATVPMGVVDTSDIAEKIAQLGF